MNDKDALIYLYALLWRSVSVSDVSVVLKEWGITDVSTGIFDFFRVVIELKLRFGTLQHACVMVEMRLLSAPSFNMDAGDIIAAREALDEIYYDYYNRSNQERRLLNAVFEPNPEPTDVPSQP